MCKVCLKVYGRYNSVSYHVTIYHRNPPIKCDQQGCTFKTREARYIHFHKYYRHHIPLPDNIDLGMSSPTSQITDAYNCALGWFVPLHGLLGLLIRQVMLPSWLVVLLDTGSLMLEGKGHANDRSRTRANRIVNLIAPSNSQGLYRIPS